MQRAERHGLQNEKIQGAGKNPSWTFMLLLSR